MLRKSLNFDMLCASEIRDIQGEILDVEGADISELEAGRGRINDNHGVGAFNCLGRITSAKKIFSEGDCDDNRQKYYWEKVKAPYIYAKGYFFDDEDHPNAKAAAAILRNIHKTDSPLKLKASVEGGIVARGVRDPRVLSQTKIHSIAITFTPANQNTLIEPLNLKKSEYDEKADTALIRSVMHLAQDESKIPSFRNIERVSSANKIHDNLVKIKELASEARGEEVTMSIPTPKDLVQSALEGKIAGNVKRMHDLVVEKSLKGKIAGAALAGTLAAGMPAGARQQQQVHPASHVDVVGSIEKQNPYLHAIAGLESTHGKRYDKHNTMTHGMHKGQTAAGPWGMMPNTAQYVMSVSPAMRDKYRDMFEKTKDVNKNHHDITDIINKEPRMAYDLADALFTHLTDKHGGDAMKAIHSWHHGLTGTLKALKTQKNIDKDHYVQAVKGMMSTRKPAAVSKALTAGYGGAAAPINRVGGGALQPESLAGKSSVNKEEGFKYITCPQCGHEQVYMKHQVKCRGDKCGKSFPLATLLRFLKSDQ